MTVALQGIGVMVLCLLVQCGVIVLMLRLLLVLEPRFWSTPSWLGSLLILLVVMLTLLVGNLAQVALWALVFLRAGEFETFLTAFYHSTVNFSTLGYGDIVLSEPRRLLGALEALNGVLMIGLTTGTLFAVMSEAMDRAWNAHHPEHRAGGKAG